MAAADNGVYIGIDLGGTEMKGGLVDLGGILLCERRTATPVKEGRLGIMRELKAAIEALIGEAGGRPVLGIGIGSAGRIDPRTGKVIYASDNLPGWSGTEIAREMEEAFGLPVFADNDVNAAALGEAWIGAARGCDTFALIALGTGVGGAVVSEGRLLHGIGGGAAEFGHFILYPGGHACNCCQRGCLEQYASGTALNRIAASIDPAWTSRILMARCMEKDPRAVEAVDAFVLDLAYGILTIKNMADPEVIVIGGGLAASADIWWDKLEANLKKLSSAPVKLARAEAGNYAGIIGAASMPLINDNKRTGRELL